jgi:hypothetical protein
MRYTVANDVYEKEIYWRNVVAEVVFVGTSRRKFEICCVIFVVCVRYLQRPNCLTNCNRNLYERTRRDSVRSYFVLILFHGLMIVHECPFGLTDSCKLDLWPFCYRIIASIAVRQFVIKIMFVTKVLFVVL